MSTPREYKILTIEDIYKKVPPDCWADCLAELARVMEYIKELAKLFGTDLGFAGFTWIDDGKWDITAPIKADEETLFEFRARQKPADEDA